MSPFLSGSAVARAEPGACAVPQIDAASVVCIGQLEGGLSRAGAQTFVHEGQLAAQTEALELRDGTLSELPDERELVVAPRALSLECQVQHAVKALGEDPVARLEALNVDLINTSLQHNHVLIDLAHHGALLQRDSVDPTSEPRRHTKEGMGVIVDAHWPQRYVGPACSRYSPQ